MEVIHKHNLVTNMTKMRNVDVTADEFNKRDFFT
jgi:hypothetical protein